VAVGPEPSNNAPGQRVARGSLAVVGAALLWGSMGPIAALYPEGSALAVAAWRLVVGALALLAAVTVARGWVPWRRGDLPVAVSGIVAVAAYSALYFPAVQLSGVAVATVVSIGAAPLMAGATHAVHGGHIDRRWLFSTCVGIVGMALVVLPGARTPDNWLGVLLALLAAVAYSWQAHSIGRLSDRHGPVETVAVLFTGAAVLFLPTAYLTLDVVTATPAAAIGAVYLGLFTTAIAYGLFAFGIPRVGAPTAVTLSLIEPVAATALAAVIVDQLPTPTQLAGIAITLVALAWLSVVRRA
jgi:DME family drug/metabolite transporter